MFCFICGCGHTGTTLLGRILGSHSKIFLIPEELGIFLANRHFNIDQITAPYLKLAESEQKPLIIDKTPRQIWHVDYIRRVWPNSKFIISTRNGPSTIASLLKRTENFDSARNRYRDDSMMSLRQKNCKDVFFSKHEDLLDKTPYHLDKIMKFLELKYEPSMMDYWKTPIPWNLKSSVNNAKPTKHDLIRNEQVNKPINKDTLDWRSSIPVKYHNKIVDYFSPEHEGEKIMSEFGYSKPFF